MFGPHGRGRLALSVGGCNSLGRAGSGCDGPTVFWAYPTKDPTYPTVPLITDVTSPYAEDKARTGKDPDSEYASIYVLIGTMTKVAVEPVMSSRSVWSSSVIVSVLFGKGVRICLRL